MPITRDPSGNLMFVPGPAQQIAEPQLPPHEAVDMDELPEKPTILTSEDGTKMQEMPDGSVILGVEVGGDDDDEDGEESFDDNLAVDMDDTMLSSLAQDILEGIEVDIQSRRQLVETYSKGLDLLGTKIEDRSNKQTRKSVSTLRHPILLEAVVTFQSGALGEMLPASGPMKVQVIGGDNARADDTAQAFEEDVNAYLTTGAPEYYPDMDRGLFNLGYGGTLFKKVYYCPLRRRPVSECITLVDLIVSENATNLDGAIRVTHRSKMNPGDVKRMQVNKIWRDVALQTPSPDYQPVEQKQKNLMGLSPSLSSRPKDSQYEIYECYTDLDPAEYGLPDEDADGLFLPYRVTVEKDSRQILEIRRNWEEGDEQFKKLQRFVMYGLVPGFGFLCLGFLHLLGNQTRALTAAWRIMMDGGMLSNFPGGLRVKGTRQTTNELNPGPGEFVEIDTGPMDDIRKAIMALPYKDVSPVFMTFVEAVAKQVNGISGAVALQSGEGRTNVPVGTIMAQIEQQTKVMAAVHKRMHKSQAQEFVLLKKLFEEYPESLTSWVKNPARKWTREDIEKYELIPASDPNVPSQTHRIMLATALVTLASNNPDIYDKVAIHKRALRAVGINDVDELVHQPPPPVPPQGTIKPTAPPDPSKMAAIQQKEADAQRKAASSLVEAQERKAELNANLANDAANRQSQEKIAEIKEETERMRLQDESLHKHHDRAIESEQRQFSSDQF